MIDPKEIYIGAHYYNGGYVERVIGRITSINGSVYRPEEMTVGLIYDMPLDEDNDPYEHTMAINLEPIPITPELLSELGLEIKEEFGSVSVWKKDNLIVKIIGERKVVSFVDKMHSLETCYLHELEAFVYLATKTELIKE